MCIIYDRFFGGTIIEADKITGERWTESAVWQKFASKACLVSHNSCKSLASNHMYRNGLPWVVIGSVFFENKVDQGIDSRYCLELDTSEDGAFECLWEGFLNFLGTCQLEEVSMRLSIFTLPERSPHLAL